MNAPQRLFLVQARTDFQVFEMFRQSSSFPHCHALHYLQMATEMLGKAHAWKYGAKAKTHRAFVGFLRALTTNRQAQQLLDYQRRNEQWNQLLRKSIPLPEKIEDLAPGLAQDGPNPEYPWPPSGPSTAPAEHDFEIWQDLQNTGSGRTFHDFIGKLFQAAEAFL